MAAPGAEGAAVRACELLHPLACMATHPPCDPGPQKPFSGPKKVNRTIYAACIVNLYVREYASGPDNNVHNIVGGPGSRAQATDEASAGEYPIATLA
jgi:hypothetical protein